MRCGRLSEIPPTRIHCVAQLFGLIVAATLLLASPAAALPAAAGATSLENAQAALKGFAYDSSSTATTPSLERRPTCCEVNGRARVRPGGGRHPLRVPSLATKPAAGRTFQTYTKTNPATGQVYSGRTSGTGTPLENIARRDSGHPYTRDGFGPAVLDRTSDSYGAIRGREQKLIELFGGRGVSANKINGIGPRNPNGPAYRQQGYDAFGPLP